jgi:AP-3 complex subunit beta
MPPSSAVVFELASLLYYWASSFQLTIIVNPLVGLIYDSPIIAQITLSTIKTISQTSNHIFIPYINHFFILKKDDNSIKALKLEILSLLLITSYSDSILNEFYF